MFDRRCPARVGDPPALRRWTPSRPDGTHDTARNAVTRAVSSADEELELHRGRVQRVVAAVCEVAVEGAEYRVPGRVLEQAIDDEMGSAPCPGLVGCEPPRHLGGTDRRDASNGGLHRSSQQGVVE